MFNYKIISKVIPPSPIQSSISIINSNLKSLNIIKMSTSSSSSISSTDKIKLSDMREDYKMGHLIEDELLESPFKMFELWMSNEIQWKSDREPNAMTLSTCSLDLKPSARIVLLKHFDERGFVFYTNYNSRKSKELTENPNAALTFLWTQRQVRIEGKVERVSREESEEYFHTRPHASQIGAWVSEFQSSEITKEKLEEDQSRLEKLYENKKVPLPPFWGGWRVIPDAFEFWQGKGGRVHDRIKYLPNKTSTSTSTSTWSYKRLSP